MYRPAGEVNEVGGDFYEAFEIEGGWMLAIGDVVGRGAPAASVTALARYTIRTAGKLTGDPRCGRIDARREPQAEDGPVAVQRHRPGASRRGRRSRAERRCSSPGTPCPCSFERERWSRSDSRDRWWARSRGRAGEVTPVELSRGDQLVLYTDGVTEARGASDRFGEDRLRASLADVSNPTQTVTRIESALDSFLGRPTPGRRRRCWSCCDRTQRSPRRPAGRGRRSVSTVQTTVRRRHQMGLGEARQGSAIARAPYRPPTRGPRNEDPDQLPHGAAPRRAPSPSSASSCPAEPRTSLWFAGR